MNLQFADELEQRPEAQRELAQVLEVEAERGAAVGEDGNGGRGIEALEGSDNAQRLVRDEQGRSGVKVAHSHDGAGAQRCNHRRHRILRKLQQNSENPAEIPSHFRTKTDPL